MKLGLKKTAFDTNRAATGACEIEKKEEEKGDKKK